MDRLKKLVFFSPVCLLGNHPPKFLKICKNHTSHFLKKIIQVLVQIPNTSQVYYIIITKWMKD